MTQSKGRALYTPIIGMEIHVELRTKSKMFCGCENNPFHAAQPNLHTCPVCLGMPGGLPVANKEAIRWTAMLGLALNCTVSPISEFSRKHYSYPDLPKGYQISQYDKPLCEHGKIELAEQTVRIRRIHLEEDTAKMQHTTVDGSKVSLIDFNRSGVPLVELVTEPDLHSAKAAGEYARKVREMVIALGISDANMEQGSMRLEANISLSKDPDVLPNYKVEIKNINSFRYLEQAIEFELDRQEKLLNDGKTPVQETRGWNERHKQTIPQRTKESAEDYRYMPDPDLPLIVLEPSDIARYQEEANTKRSESMESQLAALEQLGLDSSELNALKKRNDASILIKHLLQLKAQHSSIVLRAFGQFLLKKEIIRQSFEELLAEYTSSTTRSSIDPSLLASTIQTILEKNSTVVADIRKGKQQAIGVLVGQTIGALKASGMTNPDASILREALLQAITSSS